jgi:hypothetical protein
MNGGRDRISPCSDRNRRLGGSMNITLSSSHHDTRSTFPLRRTSKYPSRFQSTPSKQVSTHQLLALVLLHLLSITANAMIYLEDPIQALIYDSLPDPPDRYTISNVFLSNLTEGALDDVRFKVGTPLHYLKVDSSDEEPVMVAPFVSDELPDEEVIDDEDEDTSLFTNVTNTDVDTTNETTTLPYQNSSTAATNETITTPAKNTTNSTLVFDRRTESTLPAWAADPPVSSPATSSSSSIPTREISGEYTDTIHHNPQITSNKADILITGSNGNTLTIAELLGFFNDSKLVFTTETEEEYVYYDSRQARFGSDLGPKGNAAFVNLMLPPRWGEEDLVIDSGDMGEEGVDIDVMIEYVDDHGSDGNVTTSFNNTNETMDNEIGSPQEDDQSERMRGLDDVDHLLGFHDESQTNVTEMEEQAQVNASNQTQTNTTEENQTDENVTIDATTVSSVNEIVNATVSDNDEEFSGQFDTHISSFFCLDDFLSWRSMIGSSSNAIVPPASSSSSSNNMINSTRGIALMVQRGRCTFENKAELAMVFNDLLASSGKSHRIDHIIVYNNGTIDNSNNGADGEEQLVEMLRVPDWSDTIYESHKKITVGMLYLTTLSGLDLLKRMSERQNELGISPYLDISWIRGRHLHIDLTKDDGQHDVGSLVGEDSVIHDDGAVTNGWFFPATLTRFCLSCGDEMDYGFYPFVLAPGDGQQYSPDQFGPTNWPFSGDDYEPQRWVEMIRKLMIAILVILLVGPVVLATHRWHTVGGTIRMTTDENGRRRVRVISPNLEVFVNGVPDTVETNGTKLDRAQVFALPQIVYKPSSSASGSNTSENEDGDSNTSVNENGDCQLLSPNVHGDNSAENGESPDSFRENDVRCNQDNTPTLTAQITPSGSEASDMFASSSCCPICIEEFEPGETLRVLPRCNHLFHLDCILPWLTERQGCCPQCRTPVLPDEFQRSRRSSPRRPSSVLRSFRRERRQEGEVSDTVSVLTPTRLFSDIEDDLGNNTTADEMPQESRDTVVPYGVQGNESRSSHEDEANPSSLDIMEQGIVSEGAPAGDHNASGNIGIDIAAAVSAVDIENSVSAASPGEDEEVRLTTDNTNTGVFERTYTNRDADVEDNIIDYDNRDSPGAESSNSEPPPVSSNDDDGGGFNAFLRYLNTPS